MAFSSQIRLRLAVASLALALMANPGISKSSPWDTYIKQAQSDINSGNYLEARSAADEAMKLSRTFRDDDPRLGVTFHTMGDLLLREQEYGEAKQYFERAISLQQKSLGADSLEVADALYGLALCYQQKGDPMGAEIFCKRVFEIWSSKLGPTNPKLTQILPSMGVYASLNSDYKGAANWYRKLVQIQEQNYGSSSAKVGSSLSLLAAALANNNELGEAERVAQKAVDILRSNPSQQIAYDNARSSLRYIRQRMNAARGLPMPADDDEYQDEPVIPQRLNQSTESKPNAVSQAKPPVVESKPVESKPIVASKPPTDSKPPVESKPAVAEVPERRLPAGLQTAKPVESKPIVASKPAEKPVTVAMLPPPASTAIGAATPSSGNSTQKVLRAPDTPGVTTSSDDFHPWELKAEHTEIVGGKTQKDPNWGKIRYLTNGKLISQEEYKAMLLANEAYELMRSEKFRMAVEILKKALAMCNTLPSVHTNLGLTLSRLGDNTRAITELKEAIALDASRPAAWLNLASCFQLNGQLKESVVTYGEFARRFPADAFAKKAQDLANQLGRELAFQEAVAKILATAKDSGINDYFVYATHEKLTKWDNQSGVIKVYLGTGSESKGYKPEYSGFMRDAFKQWATASNSKVNFDFVNKPEGADIDCVWSDDTARVQSPSEGGETQLSYSNKGISHATITVLTAPPSPDSPLTQNQVRAVCLHEIGHALGLLGHSPQPKDVMYCSMPASDEKVSLSARDVQTVKRLYSNDVAIGKRSHSNMVSLLPRRK